MTLWTMVVRAGLTMSGVVLAFGGGGVASASAETITVDSTTWGFYKPSDMGDYQPIQNIYPQTWYPGTNPHLGHVGFVNFPQDPGWSASHYGNGHYAATAEFALPSLPDNAVVTNATFSFQPQVAAAGDVQISLYLASSIADDLARLEIGSVLTTTHLGVPIGASHGLPLMSYDMTGLWTYHLAQGVPVLGFNFVQVADTCTSFPQPYAECDVVIGNSAPPPYQEGFLLFPTLTISYDLAPVVSTVPLPAAAPMFGTALLGLAGLGLRRRRARAGAGASAT